MPEGDRSCPLCGESAKRRFLGTAARSARGIPYGVASCVRCSLRYTHPLPSAEEMAALYEDEYYAFAYDGPPGDREANGDGTAGAVGPGRSGIARLASIFVAVLLRDRVRALLGRKPGRVLDIGCGNGEFLRFLERRGWEVAGTDFSAEAVALARANGIRAHRGDLASAEFPDRAFDVVTLWHVVEHLPEPRRELAEIRRLLRDDGLLVVEVPNSDSLTRRLCGSAWRQLDVPRHLQHFTAPTLAAMLARSGFAVVRRQDFHAIDFDLVFYSVIDRLGVSRLTGIRYFSTDFATASTRAKLGFLAFGLPIALLSLPYSAIAARLGGNGESLTVTCRKAHP